MALEMVIMEDVGESNKYAAIWWWNYIDLRYFWIHWVHIYLCIFPILHSNNFALKLTIILCGFIYDAYTTGQRRHFTLLFPSIRWQNVSNNICINGKNSLLNISWSSRNKLTLLLMGVSPRLSLKSISTTFWSTLTLTFPWYWIYTKIIVKP